MPSLRRHAYFHNNLIYFSDILRKIKALYGHIVTLGDTAFLLFIETSFDISICREQGIISAMKLVLLRNNYSIIISPHSFM